MKASQASQWRTHITTCSCILVILPSKEAYHDEESKNKYIQRSHVYSINLQLIIFEDSESFQILDS